MVRPLNGTAFLKGLKRQPSPDSGMTQIDVRDPLQRVGRHARKTNVSRETTVNRTKIFSVKIAKHIGFCVYRRSCLLWPPVLVPVLLGPHAARRRLIPQKSLTIHFVARCGLDAQRG